MSEREDTCASCKWWVSDGRWIGSDNPECRRMPPTAVTSPYGTRHRQFPATYGTDYCGEFAAKGRK